MTEREIAEEVFIQWEQDVEKAMDLCVSDDNGLPTEQIPDEIDLAIDVHKAIMEQRTCEWKECIDEDGIEYKLPSCTEGKKWFGEYDFGEWKTYCPYCGKRIVEKEDK